MRLIDKLVLKEIIGPWLFGVGLFTALFMAGAYLNRLAEFIADEVPGLQVMQLTALYMPAVLAKTFTMAVLLAALLSFGRLSSDSEIVALRASGTSVARIVTPVILFSFLIALLTFFFNETIVPATQVKAAQITEQIIKNLDPEKANPVARAEVENYKLRAFINAENVNPASRALQGVTVTAYDKAGNRSFIMTAKELIFRGVDDWQVRGGATIVSPDFTQVVQVPGNIWPDAMPKISSNFAQVTSKGPPDFDSYSMADMRKLIAEFKKRGNRTKKAIRNHEYGYWNKISMPLAAVIFGTLGAVLGIRGHRAGTSTGFALAVAIIFGYLSLANFMNVWAQSGFIPPYVASFAPLVVGLGVALFIMWKRNG